SRQAFEQLAKNFGYNTLLVWVQIDEATAHRRSTSKSYGKNDPTRILLPDEVFDRYAKRTAAPNHRENTVVISGKHTFASQAKAVVKKLVTPREETAFLANNGNK